MTGPGADTRPGTFVGRALVDQRVRYLLVGGYNTVAGYLVFAALYLVLHDAVHYLLLAVVANVIGILNAFAAYRLVVFKVRGNILRDLVRFASVYLAALAINLAVLPLAVEVLGLPPLVAQALVIAVTVCVSYLGHKNYSFRRPAAADPEAVSS